MSEPADHGRTAGRQWRYWIGLLAALLLGAYFASGFYLVNADEHAVVRRFGAIAARVGPGMHYRMPWPVARVDVLKTTSVMKVGVGFVLRDNDSDVLKGIELLTGDTNILNVALVSSTSSATPPIICSRSIGRRRWSERSPKAS